MKLYHFDYKNIVLFLQARNWTIFYEDNEVIQLTPPSEIKFSEASFKWNIPKDVTITYYRQIRDVIKDISTMYELDENDLIELFSKPYQQVKKDAILLKNMAQFV